MESNLFHIPVLLQEAVSILINPEIQSHIIVDGTLGGGGYSERICRELPEGGRLIAVDKDLNALAFAGQRLKDCSKIEFVNDNFGNLEGILRSLAIEEITGIVLDLGLSSYQLEEEEGFSFMKDTPLDMRAYKKDEITAWDILNTYSAGELTEMFESFGEIGNAERLARAVIQARNKGRLKTTFDIAAVVDAEYSINPKDRIKFLAKIFQALRIAVNNELNNLQKVLADSLKHLRKGGRMVIISYHSLEDRIVKDFLKENSKKEKVSKYKENADKGKEPTLKILTKKAIVPGYEEVKSNSRARSAKLRAAEKI
jgi:16S rRNA (cytosine1402-N4)-methyltransferase